MAHPQNNNAQNIPAAYTDFIEMPFFFKKLHKTQELRIAYPIRNDISIKNPYIKVVPSGFEPEFPP